MQAGLFQHLHGKDIVHYEVFDEPLWRVDAPYSFASEPVTDVLEGPIDGPRLDAPQVRDLGLSWKPAGDPEESRLCEGQCVVRLSWREIATVEECPRSTTSLRRALADRLEEVVELVGSRAGGDPNPTVARGDERVGGRRQVGPLTALMEEPEVEGGSNVVKRPRRILGSELAGLAVEVEVVGVENEFGSPAETQWPNSPGDHAQKLDGESPRAFLFGAHCRERFRIGNGT